jgi:hypothetical protein
VLADRRVGRVTGKRAVQKKKKKRKEKKKKKKF